MIIFTIAVVVTACVVGYLFYQRKKDKPAQDAINTAGEASVLRLADYLKYCADHNLTPYEDIALAKKWVG